MAKPRVTGTTHELPFEKLSSRDFERMCLWLVRREGYPTAEHHGAAGGDRGRDLVAKREAGIVALQCKREKQFGPAKAREAVRKILAEGPAPTEIILLVACDVSADTREKAAAAAGAIPCVVWARTELDERMNRHREIVEYFFGLASRRALRRLIAPTLVALGVGALATWQGKPVATSVVLGVGAGLVALALAFGRLVWEKLETKWAQSVADWIDAQVRLYGSLIFSGFRRRYFQQLRYRHRVFNVRGLRTQGVFTLELERVFVDLKLAPQSLEAISPDLLRAEGLTRTSSIWEMLVSEHGAFRSLAVIGAPGCGKTTLLQHLALIFAQNEQRRYEKRCRTFVPILLLLRDHADAVTVSDPPALARLVTSVESGAGLKPPAQWFERKLEAGKALVLLDGLDEVADAEKRKKVVAWVAEQIQRYGASRFIVTSRPHGYKTNPLPAATVVEVQPFTLRQVERFVGGWYLANEILSFGKDDSGVRQKAQEQGRDLLRRLRSTPTLAALAVNPLLLTMIAMVHRYRGALPGRRVELYSEICDVLLGHWQAAKGLPADLTAAQQRVVLEQLAFYLMSSRIREVSAAEAEQVITEPLRGVRRGSVDAREFLRGVQSGSGLLLERETGVYSFAHLTFQEYLAAQHLLRVQDPEALLGYADDSWWHEVLRLYAAQSDATPIVQACLDAAQPRTLTLAYECSQEAMSLEAKVADRLERELIEGLEAPDSESRRLAAEVMLELRLRNFLRLNKTVEIDTSYVSCAEYQLFLDDRRAAGDYRQPDHWRDTQFQEGDAQKPIAGVRRSDAVSFCEWLTAKAAASGDLKHRFRLPSVSEVESHRIQVVEQGDRFDSLRVDSVGTWTGGQPRFAGLAADALEQYGNRVNRALERALDVDLDHPSDLGLARALARDRALATARRLARAPLLDRALDRNLDRNHAHALVEASLLVLDPALDLASNSILDRATVLNRAHILDRTRARTRARVLKRARARVLDRAHVLVRALALDIEHARDRVFDLYINVVGLLDRIEGELPAWESIQIVRERIPEEYDG